MKNKKRWAFLNIDEVPTKHLPDALGLSADFTQRCDEAAGVCHRAFKNTTADKQISQIDFIEILINGAQPDTIIEALYAGYLAGGLFVRFHQISQQQQQMSSLFDAFKNFGDKKF